MAITAQEVIDRVVLGTGCTPREVTVDTLKTGGAGGVVEGIAVSFMSTFDVLRRAAARKLNMIITHEPTFYDGQDRTDHIAGDPLFAAKTEFIAQQKLIIWRCHDYWHARRPDGILEGMVAALGWKEYQHADAANVFTLPPTTLGELARTLKKTLGASVVRGTGDAAMPVRTVAMAPGSPGARPQIKLLQRPEVQVLITGESTEWETNEYVRDATDAGLKKGLILVGHCNSEEAGMEFMTRWLRELIPGLPIEFIPAGDPFWLP